MDGVTLVWEGALTFQRSQKIDERHFKFYDSGVLVRYDKPKKNIKEIMVVLYAPAPKKPEVDNSKVKPVSFTDTNGIQRNFTTTMPFGKKTESDDVYEHDDIRKELWNSSIKGPLEHGDLLRQHTTYRCA